MKITLLNNGRYTTDGSVTFPVTVEDESAKVISERDLILISSSVLMSAGFTELNHIKDLAFCLKGHCMGAEAVILDQ